MIRKKQLSRKCYTIVQNAKQAVNTRYQQMLFNTEAVILGFFLLTGLSWPSIIKLVDP